MPSANTLLVTLEDAISNIDYPGADSAEWEHKAKVAAKAMAAELHKWEKRKERIQRWIEKEQASTGKTVVNGDTVWRMLEGYLS